MWGQLGGKLGAKDWNAALQKIGNAVAPPPGDNDDDDDDEYYDEDEEGEDYEEEEEEYYEEDDDAKPTGFGFVGMLARALDQSQQGDDDEEEEEQQEDGGYINAAEQPMIESDVPSKALFDDWDEPSPVKQSEPTPTKQSMNSSKSSEDSWYEQSPKAASQDHASSPMEKPVYETFEPFESLPSQHGHSEMEAHPVSFEASSQLPREEMGVEKCSSEMIFPGNTDKAISSGKNSDTTSGESEIDDLNIDIPHSSTAKASGRAANTDAMLEKESEFRRPSPKEDTQSTLSREKVAQIERPVAKEEINSADADAFKSQMLRTTADNAIPLPTAADDSLPHRRSRGKEPKSPTRKKEMDTLELNSSAEGPMNHELATEVIDRQVKVTPQREVYDDPINPSIADENEKVHLLDARLQQYETQIIELQKQLMEEAERGNQIREKLMMQFQEKEARLLQASSEEYQHEMLQAEHRHKAELQVLEMQLADEKNDFIKKQQKFQQMIEESNARAERAEIELKNTVKKHESKLAQSSQQEQRSVRMAEEKLAKSLALLDERDEEISRLKETVKKLESSMNEHEEGVEEAEQEVEELQIENEQLQDHVEKLGAECAQLKEKIVSLETDSSQLGTLRMELTMLREERDRERAKNHSVVQSTITSHSQVESERDAALAEVRDLKQQLTAARADLEIGRADQERIMTANSNLQSALEAFQDERQAEMNMIDEQRMEAEEAIISAHAASMEALKQTHAEEIRQVQYAAQESVRRSMDQVTDLKTTLAKLKAENAQTRRSLDEAIHRLQTTQEDVIDRTLMKNILLDWCTMKDKEKRRQVLELMASVLHFTEKEKESVHLTHMDIESVRSRVVGALALPPSKASLEKLEGDNVHEKWVNFLMAETDDGI